MTIGARITRLRKQRDISQTALAKALEVSRQAVSKWEQDQSYPDTKKLIELAALLDTSVQYLAAGTHPEARVVVQEQVVEKVVVEEKVVIREVEKEVIRHVQRKPVQPNPLDKYLLLAMGFAAGLLLGLLF